MLKGLLGVYRCKAYVPYIMQKNYDDGSVKVEDPGDSKVCKVKSKVLRALPLIDKALEMVSPMLGEPQALKSSY